MRAVFDLLVGRISLLTGTFNRLGGSFGTFYSNRPI